MNERKQTVDNVFEEILYNMDASLYVSDFATDELLFFNKRVKNLLKLDDDSIGKPCWKALMRRDERCSFCPKHKLKPESGASIEWETHMDVLDRYLRNCGQVQLWSNGRLAYVQHSFDITGLRHAEASATDRLRQQELMTELSANFIASGDMDTFVDDALDKIGSLMGYDCVHLAVLDDEGKALKSVHDYRGERTQLCNSCKVAATLSPGNIIYDLLMEGNQACVEVRGELCEQFECSRLAGIQTSLLFRIQCEGNFLGVLKFDMLDTDYQWTDSDRHIGGLSASLLAGVLNRRHLSKSLTLMSEVVSRTSQIIAYFDYDGKFSFFNPALCEVSGYSAEELSASGIDLLHDEDTLRRVHKEIIPAVSRGEKLNVRLPLIRKDGSLRNIEMSLFQVDYGMGAIVSDITEDLQLMCELKATKERLDVAEESSRAGIWEVNVKAQTLSFDEAFAKLMHIELPSPITVSQFADHVEAWTAPATHKDYPDHLRNRVDGSRPVAFPNISYLFDPKRPTYISSTSKVVEDTDGNLERIIGMSIDVTELREAEVALEKRLEQQELMSDIAQMFVKTNHIEEAFTEALSSVAHFLKVNSAFIYRYEDSDDCFHLLHNWMDEGLDVSSVNLSTFTRQVVFEYCLDDDMSVTAKKNISMPVDSADGKTTAGMRTSHINAPLLISGKLWGFVGAANIYYPRTWTDEDNDMLELFSGLLGTAIGRNMAELRRDVSEKTLQTVIDGLHQSVFWKDTTTGAFEGCNNAFVRMSRHSVDEVVGKTDEEIFSRRAAEIFKQGDRQALEMTEPFSYTQQIQTGDGENRILRVVKTVVRDAMGNPIRLIGNAEDISEQYQLQKQLEEAIVAAEEASSAKSDFLSRMSHEIRTPMNAIMGMTRIGMSSSDAGRKQYCLEKIDVAASSLLELINQILDMSKIEANKLELAREEFDFERVLSNICTVMGVRIGEKSQELTVAFDRDFPTWFVGDEVRISQVITNLLSNAAKFTPEKGTISVKVELLEQSDGHSLIRMSVSDTGIGITKEQQARIFNSFEQAEGGTSRKYGGTGLGLSICKKLVNMMGGDISVESTYGHGSTFRFTLRLKNSARQQGLCRLSPIIDRSQLRVLVVDDTPDVREYFQYLLMGFGIQCDAAENAAEAMAMARRSVEEKAPYGAIFVDFEMPDMNGLDAARQIREIIVSDPVVMASSVEWAVVQEQARRLGITRFVSKPLFPSAIFSMINDLMHAEVEQAKPFGRQMGDLTGKVFLLAEDVEINREIVLSLLEDTGVSVDIAENGARALELFERDPDRYDLIFMDVQMPEMDGHEATRRIRLLDNSKAKSVPIVAMTANVFREDVEKCLASGMNDHISKPIDLNDLQDKIERYIHFLGC